MQNICAMVWMFIWMSKAHVLESWSAKSSVNGSKIRKRSSCGVGGRAFGGVWIGLGCWNEIPRNKSWWLQRDLGDTESHPFSTLAIEVIRVELAGKTQLHCLGLFWKEHLF